jgi:hypothetical protein
VAFPRVTGKKSSLKEISSRKYVDSRKLLYVFLFGIVMESKRENELTSNDDICFLLFSDAPFMVSYIYVHLLVKTKENIQILDC